VPPRSRELAWPSWEAGKALEATLAARPLQLGQIVRSGDGEQKQEDADYENDKGYHGSVWRVLCDAGGGGGQDPRRRRSLKLPRGCSRASLRPSSPGGAPPMAIARDDGRLRAARWSWSAARAAPAACSARFLPGPLDQEDRRISWPRSLHQLFRISDFPFSCLIFLIHGRWE